MFNLHFDTALAADMIERRKPLAPTARRAGWVGCNILLEKIPDSGKIFYVKNGVATPEKEVLTAFQKNGFFEKRFRFPQRLDAGRYAVR